MRNHHLAAVVLLFFCARVTLDASATDHGALVLRNVTIVDIERNRLQPQRDVVVAGGRVVGIRAGSRAAGGRPRAAGRTRFDGG